MFHVKQSEPRFDVVVIGGGHAGCEAAHAAYRMGAQTALVTHSIARIGEMSCNPAMGGLGKGHLIREIDALDGLIGRVSDRAGIQFRLLNRSRGPAVRGPRAQIDREIYRREMQAEFQNLAGLKVLEAEVSRLVFEGDRVVGLETAAGFRLLAGAVVLTTGTFLRGVIHIGAQRRSGGREGDDASITLADQLRGLELRIGRLKTGTPARLLGESIDFSVLEDQPADPDPEPFSFLNDAITQPQVSCAITATNSETHRIIRENLSQSALFGGAITGAGPRYCPSIEDKVERFADKAAHQVFLEPETRDGRLIYPNGVSTSLPAAAQLAFLRTMRGLERVEIAQPGYAIEYDFVDPTEVTPDLAVKKAPGLFLAGQILGTTGYEEAAGLGLLAGANAARAVAGGTPLRFERSEAYLGVMVDDLVSKGVTEPYRMFTSRAEFRLQLRVDNADERLTERGAAIGLVGERRLVHYRRHAEQLAQLRSLLDDRRLSPHEVERLGISVNKDGARRSLFDLLAYPDVTFDRLVELQPALGPWGERARARVEAEAVYRGYLDRQKREAALLAEDRSLQFPEAFDFNAVSALSAELREKLTRVQPRDLAQARAIEGMTPSALAILAPFASLGATGT